MLKLSWEIPFPKYEVSQGFCVYTLFSSAVQYGYRAVNAKLRCQTCWFIVSFLVFSLYHFDARVSIILPLVKMTGLSRVRSKVKALRGLDFSVWLLNWEPDWAVATGHERAAVNRAVCWADMLYQVAAAVKVGLYSQWSNDLVCLLHTSLNDRRYFWQYSGIFCLLSVSRLLKCSWEGVLLSWAAPPLTLLDQVSVFASVADLYNYLWACLLRDPNGLPFEKWC